MPGATYASQYRDHLTSFSPRYEPLSLTTSQTVLFIYSLRIWWRIALPDCFVYIKIYFDWSWGNGGYYFEDSFVKHSYSLSACKILAGCICR